MKDTSFSSSDKPNGKSTSGVRRKIDFSVRERIVPCSTIAVIPFLADFYAHTFMLPDTHEKPHDFVEEDIVPGTETAWDSPIIDIPKEKAANPKVIELDRVPFGEPLEMVAGPIYYSTPNSQMVMPLGEPSLIEGMNPPAQPVSPDVTLLPGESLTTNAPPNAALDLSTDANNGLSEDPSIPILFDGTKSFDTDGFIAQYTFDFGDGNSYSESFNLNTGRAFAPDGNFDGITQHQYADYGIYNSSLTVTDNFGLSDTVYKQVVVNDVPDIVSASIVRQGLGLSLDAVQNTTDNISTPENEKTLSESNIVIKGDGWVADTASSSGAGGGSVEGNWTATFVISDKNNSILGSLDSGDKFANQADSFRLFLTDDNGKDLGLINPLSHAYKDLGNHQFELSVDYELAGLSNPTAEYGVRIEVKDDWGYTGKSNIFESNSWTGGGTGSIDHYNYLIDIDKGAGVNWKYAGTSFTNSLTISDNSLSNQSFEIDAKGTVQNYSGFDFTSIDSGKYDMKVIGVDSTGNYLIEDTDQFSINDRPNILNPGDDPSKTPDNVDDPLYDPKYDPPHTIDDPTTPFVEGRLDAVKNTIDNPLTTDNEAVLTLGNIVEQGKSWTAISNAYDTDGTIASHQFWIDIDKNGTFDANEFVGIKGAGNKAEILVSDAKFTNLASGDYQMKVLVTDNTGLTASSIDSFTITERPVILHPGDNPDPKITPKNVDDPNYPPVVDPNPSTDYVEGDLDAVKNDGSLNTANNIVQPNTDWIARANAIDPDGTVDSYQFWIKDNSGTFISLGISTTPDINVDHTLLSLTEGQDYEMKVLITDNSGLTAISSDTFHVNDKADILSATVSQPGNSGIPSVTLDAVKGSTDDPITTTINEGTNVVNQGDNWIAASDGTITPTGSGSLDWTASFVVSDTDNAIDGASDSFKFTITDKNGDQLITPLTTSYTDLGGGQYKVDITFDGSGLSVDPLSDYTIKLEVTDDYSGVSNDNSKFFTTQPPSAGVPTIDKYEYWIDSDQDGTFESNEIVLGNTNDVDVNSSTFSQFSSLLQGQDYNMKVVLTDTNGNTAQATSIFHVNYKPQLTGFNLQQPTTGGSLNSESLDAVTTDNRNPNFVNTWENWNAQAYAQIGSGGGSTNWVATFTVTDTDNLIDGNNDVFTFAITDDNNPGSFTQITSSDIVSTQYYDIGGGQYEIRVEFNMPAGTSFSGTNTNSYGVEFNITDDSGGNTVDQSKTFTYDDSVGPTNAIEKYEFWIDDNKNGIYEDSEKVFNLGGNTVSGDNYTSSDGNVTVDRTKFTFMPGEDFNMKVRITDTQNNYVETYDNFRVNAPPIIAGIAVDLDSVGTINSGTGNADVNQIQLGDIFTPTFSAQNFLAAGNNGIGTYEIFIDLNHDGDYQWWLGEQQWVNPGQSIDSTNFNGISLVAGESYLMKINAYDNGYTFVGSSVDEFSVAPITPPASNLKVDLDSVVNSNNGGNSSTNTLAPGINHQVPAKPSIYGGVSNVDNNGPYNAAGKFVGGYDQFGNAYDAAYDEFRNYVGGYSFDSLTNSYVNDGYGAYDNNGVFVGGFDSSGNILNNGSYDINGNKVGNYDMKFTPGIPAQYGYNNDFDTTNSFDVQVNLAGSSGSISYEYWIDFDRNGFFDSYESVGSNSLSGVGNNFTFTIDNSQFSQINDFKPGEAYRMQVLIHDDSTGESQYAFDTFNIYSGNKNVDRIYPLAFQQGTDINGDPIINFNPTVNLGDNTKILIPTVSDVDGNGTYADYRLPFRQDLSYPDGYRFFFVANDPYSILDSQLNKIPLLPGIQYNLEFGLGDNNGAGAYLQRSPTLFVNAPPQLAGINVNLDSVTDNYALGKSDTLVDLISPSSNWTATANASSAVGEIVKYEFYIDSQNQNQLFESNELVGTSNKGDLNFGTVTIDYAAAGLNAGQSYLMKVVATDDKGNTTVDYDRFNVNGGVAHKFDIDAVKNSFLVGQEGTLSNQVNAGSSWIVDTNFSSVEKTAVANTYQFWIDTNNDGVFSDNEGSQAFYGGLFDPSIKSLAQNAINNLYGGASYFANGEIKIDPSTFKNINSFVPLIAGEQYNLKVEINSSVGPLYSYDNFTYVNNTNPIIGFDAVQDNTNIPATVNNIVALGQDWTLTANGTDTDAQQYNTYEYWINTGDNITPNWSLVGASNQPSITLNTDTLKMLTYDGVTNSYVPGVDVTLNTSTTYDMKVVIKDIIPLTDSTFSSSVGSEFHSSISFVQAPQAVADTVTLTDPSGGTTANIDVLSNDLGFTGTLKVTVDNPSLYGFYTVNPDNTITYTVTDSGGLATAGGESTIYTVTDANGFTDKGIVNIKAQYSPGANDDTDYVNYTAKAEINVLNNDTNINGQPIYVTSSTDGAYGTVSQGSAGSLVYEATDLAGLQAKGFDTFTYTITNDYGISDTATVTVNYVNSAPLANNDIASRTNLSDTNITIKALANDVDPDGDAISINASYPLTSANGYGTITLNPDQTLTYTITDKANFDASGDSFTYQIKDAVGNTSIATVNLTASLPANNDPVTNPDSGSVLGGLGSTTTIKVLTNDYDPDGDTLTISGVTAGSFGTASINLDGTITYTITDDTAFKAAGGLDQISYTIEDGKGGSKTEFVSISRINTNTFGVNDKVTVNEDTWTNIKVWENDFTSDPGALDTSTIVLSSNQTAMGGYISNYQYNTSGRFFYYKSPLDFNNNGFNGSNAPGGTMLDSFTYQIKAADGSLSKPITVEVNVLPVDDTPQAVNDSVRSSVVAIGSSLEISLSGKAPITFNGSSTISNPTWSPDLNKIAFNMNGDIYTIKADGTGLTQITNTPFITESRIGWSPSGSKLTYLADNSLDGYKDLYVIKSDGTGVATDLIVDYDKSLSSYNVSSGLYNTVSGQYINSGSIDRGLISWSPDEQVIQYDVVSSSTFSWSSSFTGTPYYSYNSFVYSNGYINSTTGVSLSNPSISTWYSHTPTYQTEDLIQGYLIDSSNVSGVNIYVLNNDYPDTDGDPFSITSPASFTTSRGGTVLNDGTKLTYIGNPTYTGPDIFSYTITGGSTATVQVWVF